MARVLIIDDNADERRIFATALYYNGFEVDEAETGMDGITAAKAVPPDVILMDVRLPDMTGFLATEIIHAAPGLAGVPVICITGMDITPQDADARGCRELLIKPVEITELVNAVQRVLARSREA